jgi:hypothetical protein
MQTRVAHPPTRDPTLERFRLAAIKTPRQRQPLDARGDQLLDQASDRRRRVRAAVNQRGRTLTQMLGDHVP